MRLLGRHGDLRLHVGGEFVEAAITHVDHDAHDRAREVKGGFVRRLLVIFGPSYGFSTVNPSIRLKSFSSYV
jgi:hypothetical protein